MFIYHDVFRRELAETLSQAVEKTFNVSVSWEKIYSLFGPTPNKEAGDLAFPLFIIAKDAKQSPALAAKALEQALNTLPSFIKSKKALGPYLNFCYDYTAVARVLLPEIVSGETFKKKLTEDTPKTMMEYSQPNTHKEMHVGHMRNLCLGDALIRLHRYCGYDVVATTFPGDVGTHVAKCLWYLKFHYQGKEPSARKGAWLGSMYSTAHNKLEEEKGSPKEALNNQQLTMILKQLEQKTGEFYDLWKVTRQWSIELMNEVYQWADVKFDVWYWESEVDSESVKLAHEYFEKGLFTLDKGCIGVDLSDHKLGFCMLIKSDGNGLYATKDIELARRKFEDYRIEKNIYVVDKRQEHHFKQVFKVLELMGFENAKKCHHLPYDFVELPDGPMSSRKGNIIPLQSLIENMEKMIKDQYLSRYENDWAPAQVEETARIIARGAIKYGMTRIDPAKKIVFDLQDWLKLDGESGPYVQYAYARITSMLSKVGEPVGTEIVVRAPQENELILQLMNFHHVVEQATEQYKPSVLTAYLFDLSRAFNGFYAECPVGSEPEPVRSSRLKLSSATAKTLKKGLELLGIDVPEKM
ncbi:MAG TPA: arginine--tRNA ligase [Bacteriovoracaceae bacterium]|nr:arginine--tRNA ligase [Bacteriovoracaceae bacterium]